MSEASSEKPSLRKRFSFKRTLTSVLFVSAVFLFGVALGQGRIVLGKDAVFRKTVNSDLPDNLDYDTVESVYDSLRQNFDGKLTRDQLLDGIKEGLAQASGDAYTEYLNPAAAKDFNQELNGTFTGIGAELSKDAETNTIVVVSPIAGFPAEKAGLKPKDVIVEIDGKSALDQSVSQAVSQIRGDAGTNVKLKVIRGGTEELNFDITRQSITIPSVTTKTLEGNIGYIKIARFSEDTTDLVTKAAEGFQATVVKGMILDLRGDPGGLLNSAVEVSSLWLDNKVVLTERRDGTVVRTFNSKGTPVLKGIPTVVLVDAGSASASEITAGALRDNNVATIIGEKSFGKGSVQQLVKFRDDSVLKVTIARWYTPSGKNIDKEGISPDKEVKNVDADVKAGKDAQLDAARAELVN